MAIRLNHTIVAAKDKEASARFLTEILDLPAHRAIGPFAVVQLSDDTSLDFADDEGEIAPQHYAFLVDESEFDAIFARIRERKLTYWADPFRREPGRINEWDGGRGVYFDDPSGHLLEAITRPYGSGGSTSSKLHPLFAGR
jgi:catechol 2,3-dioxygenase-like lactoylglutathione lyase family enzyme